MIWFWIYIKATDYGSPLTFVKDYNFFLLKMSNNNNDTSNISFTSTTTTTATTTTTTTTTTTALMNTTISRNPPVTWNEHEIQLLIDQRRYRNVEYHQMVGRSRVEFWNSVARRINRAVGSNFNGLQCRRKFDNLVSIYNVSKMV